MIVADRTVRAVSDDYFEEIQSHFAMRRGTPFPVGNPKDWALMKEWAAAGIPLPVVIEAIDSVFDKATARDKTVNSLMYCRHAVKEIWAQRRDLQAGAEEVAPEEDAAPLLERLAAELEGSSAPAGVVADVSAAVRELAREKSVPRIEERLIALEHELIERTLAASAEAAALRADAASLGDTSRLDEKTRARTVEANLRRLVRDRFALPRLTLFS